jgi:hypothetical protein
VNPEEINRARLWPESLVQAVLDALNGAEEAKKPEPPNNTYFDSAPGERQ